MTLLSVAELKEHISTSLGDEALQRLLDAAEEQIVAAVGDSGETTELLRASGPLLALSRVAESISDVVEDDVTLAADDYELQPGSRLVRRLSDGTNARRRWHGWVDITYLPLDDSSRREMAQVALVKLDIATNPTLASQTIGSWSETYATNASYTQTRADILASLLVDPLVML